MTDRYTRLSDRARWFLNNFDEIDLADLCANYEAAAKTAQLDHAAAPHTLCANLRPGSHTTVCDLPAGHGNHRGATGYGERVTWPAATEATQTETTARVFAGLHHSAEQDVTRVINLYEQWVKAGPPPLGVSLSRWWDQRLVELHQAILPTSTEPATPAVAVEVRDPCPRCEGSPTLIPRHAMTDHMRTHHPEEQQMPDTPTTPCTASIEGPTVLDGGPIHCTREAGHPANHVGPKQGANGKTLWNDDNAGATPHRAPGPA